VLRPLRSPRTPPRQCPPPERPSDGSM
jgi:hypothetical protein